MPAVVVVFKLGGAVRGNTESLVLVRRQVDIHAVPDFNTMYELYDPCTIMFFFRNKVGVPSPLLRPESISTVLWLLALAGLTHHQCFELDIDAVQLTLQRTSDSGLVARLCSTS